MPPRLAHTPAPAPAAPRALVVALAAVGAASVALLGAGCAGPCRTVAAQRRALEVAPPAAERTAAPHARVQIPFPLANRLIAEALAPPPELGLPLGGLGPLARVIGDVRAIPREVTLAPGAAPGRVRATVRIELADSSGELLTVRASGDVAPLLAQAGDRLSLAFETAQLPRLEPELGPRAAAQLGALLEGRLPESLRGRFPRFAVDRIAAAVVEEVLDRGWRLLHESLLPLVRERARIALELPDVPIARMAVATSEAAISLELFTTLPVRAGVAPPPPPEPDAILVQIAGDTAARAANWGIAHGALPPRYTRKLEPAADGTYVPHFEWRAGDPVRPLVVHMFKVEGGCAHFAVGVQPRVEVADGSVRAWIANRQLEHADAPIAFELLARTKALVERSTSSKKRGPGSVRITVGDREVTTRLVRAEIAGDELRAAVVPSIAPVAAPTAAPPPAS